MTVSCPDCRSVFRVDPAKVPATGVRARCSVCGGVIAISGGTLPVSVTPSSSRAVASSFGSSATPTPASAAAAHGGSARPFATASAGVGVATPPSALPIQSAVPSAASAQLAAPLASPVPPTLMTPPAPAGLPSLSQVRGARTGAESSLASPASFGVTPPHRPVAPAPLPTPVPIPYPNTAANVATPTPASTTPGGGKRSINPFLNADPGSRARRLARALVSDLVAYNPQKRESGLRDGTLRQLFREEIKKSYEEYVEQVGRELAESTPHFQDALNEILGGGRKLF